MNQLNIFFFSVYIFINSFFSYSFEIKLNSTFNHHEGFNLWNLKEDGELNLMEKILAPNQVVMDVGANIGDWSILALNLQPTLNLTAFEPVPQTFEILKKKLESYPQVILTNAALSDVSGIANFAYYNDDANHVFSGLYKRKALEGLIKDPSLIDVNLLTLSFYCITNGIDHIDFLKIDTEGAEWKVLKGAEDLIVNHQISLIQFEYGGCYLDANTTLQQIYELFVQNNYYVFRIIPTGLIHIKTWDINLENFYYSNYFAVCKDDFGKFFPLHFTKKNNIRYGNFE